MDHRYGYCYDNCEPQYSDYEQGTLVIDLVDTNTNKVVWRGWAQDSMNGIIDNQDRLEQQVDESVTKMMMRLPSGGAAAALSPSGLDRQSEQRPNGGGQAHGERAPERHADRRVDRGRAANHRR